MANQRMTQTQLVKGIAEKCELTNKQARAALDCLAASVTWLDPNCRCTRLVFFSLPAV